MLKLDPKSTELLSQKQTVLKQNIEQTTKKVEALKEAQKKYIESGGDLNTEQYRNLQREIINTENKLKQLKLEASNWTQLSRNLSELSSKMKSFGDKVSKVGKTLTTTVTIPIVSLGTLATKGAIDFESAFTGVEKTVDGTAEQMKNLKQGIRDLAKEIPSSTTEIAAVAEAAGQLGIHTEDILSFTKVMIDLGNSTNLSATEAASSLAKFANVTQMSAKDYDRLGATIVALGNNFATTESDIVAMSTRLAATGELAGLNQAQILSLATALSSVGIEAEAGGTAMSKLLKKIQVAVETGTKDLDNLEYFLKQSGYSIDDLGNAINKGGKTLNAFSQAVGTNSKDLKAWYKRAMKSAAGLEEFSDVAGMTADEFKKAFEEDAVKALSAFISGLNDTERNGASAIAILEDMGIKEVRLSNTILSLANASNVLTDAVKLGDEAWEENSALTNEATKRYNTLQSKIDIVKNKIQDIGITLGSIIMPYVESFVNKIGDLTEKFQNLSPQAQEMIVKIGAFLAIIGPLVLLIGKIISIGGTLLKGISFISGVIANLSAGVGGLSGALTILSGPIGIAIGAVALLTGEFIALWNQSESFRNSITEIGQSIIETYNSHIKPTIDNIVSIIQMLWLDILQPLLKYLWEKFSPIIEKVFIVVGQAIAGAFEKASIIVQSLTGVLKGLIQFITGVFTGDWAKAWEGIKTIFGNVFEGLKGLFKAPINWIISKLNSFISSINGIQIPDWVPGVGGKGINIPQIPQLAKGGIVDSATLAMIGEGKSAEAVIPLDKTLAKYMAEALKIAGGSRNIVMNFYPQQMTEAELERAFNYVDRRFGILY